MHIQQRRFAWRTVFILAVTLFTMLSYGSLSAQRKTDVQKRIPEKNATRKNSGKRRTTAAHSAKIAPTKKRAKQAPKSTAKEASRPHAQPVGYELIVKNNLFKPLGSGDEKRGPTFRLVGIVGKEDRQRALIEEGGRLHDVVVGQEISSGHRLLSIEDNGIDVDGPDGKVSLSLSDWSGTDGIPSGGRPGPPRRSVTEGSPKRASSKSGKGFSEQGKQSTGDRRRDAIRQMLEKKGFSQEDVEIIMNNPEKLEWAEDQMEGDRETDSNYDRDEGEK